MVKIYLAPSDQDENIYAVGGTNEAAQCNKIAEYLEAAFKRQSGIEVKRNTTYAISKGIKESNSWGSDYHICIHTNAFNGSVMGTRMFYWSGNTEGQKACVAIMARLAPITPGESDNITGRSDLSEPRQLAATSIYCEVGFHDNKTEAQWIINHTKDVAEAICQGMCDYLGITYVAEKVEEPAKETPAETSNVLYKVQCGAFSVKANAQKFKETLANLDYFKENKINPFIVEVKK